MTALPSAAALSTLCTIYHCFSMDSVPDSVPQDPGPTLVVFDIGLPDCDANPSILFRQQCGCGGSLTLVVCRFGNDPVFKACLVQIVCRQDSRSDVQFLVVQLLVFVRQITPVFRNVPLHQIDYLDIGFLQCLDGRRSGQQLVDWEVWLANLNHDDLNLLRDMISGQTVPNCVDAIVVIRRARLRRNCRTTIH